MKTKTVTRQEVHDAVWARANDESRRELGYLRCRGKEDLRQAESSKTSTGLLGETSGQAQSQREPPCQ